MQGAGGVGQMRRERESRRSCVLRRDSSPSYPRRPRLEVGTRRLDIGQTGDQATPAVRSSQVGVHLVQIKKSNFVLSSLAARKDHATHPSLKHPSVKIVDVLSPPLYDIANPDGCTVEDVFKAWCEATTVTEMPAFIQDRARSVGKTSDELGSSGGGTGRTSWGQVMYIFGLTRKGGWRSPGCERGWSTLS